MSRPRSSVRAALAATLAATLAAETAAAATLTVHVVDAAGQPLADAVVYAEPAAKRPGAQAAKPAVIEQVGRRFSPIVSVVQVGTAVSFPNLDTVRHHGYSFSPARTFDIKLYSGVPAAPVVFDKPGTVVLGCNIHDKMVAYVHVVDTPHFGRTDAAGQARLEDVPAGAYQLKAWHPRLAAGAQPAEQALVLKADAAAAFKLERLAP